MAAVPADKPAEWRRWLGIALRTAHIAAVALLAAQLLGAGGVARWGAWAAFATGLAMLASELADRRIHLAEVAGATVLLKLALVAAMALWPATAQALFWAVLALSAVISHAPKGLRHWRPGA
jgi:hypothetical protein